MGFTRKKAVKIERKRYTVRIERARQLCKRILRSLPMQNLIFIDETHFSRKDLCRAYGRALAGERVQTSSHNLARESWCLIGALCWKGLLHWEIYNCEDGSITHKEFDFFISNLASKISNKYIVVLDNARIHKLENYSRILEDMDICYIRLSPYSCDFSPIELLWNTVKSRLTMKWNSSKPLDELIERALNSSTEDEIHNYFIHCQKIWNEN